MVRIQRNEVQLEDEREPDSLKRLAPSACSQRQRRTAHESLPVGDVRSPVGPGSHEHLLYSDRWCRSLVNEGLACEREESGRGAYLPLTPLDERQQLLAVLSKSLATGDLVGARSQLRILYRRRDGKGSRATARTDRLRFRRLRIGLSVRTSGATRSKEDARVSRVSLTTDLTHNCTRSSLAGEPNPALRM